MSQIIIADTHILCREALCSFIRQSEENFKVIGAADFRELETLVSEREVDLLLAAQDFPDFESIGALSCEKFAVIVDEILPEWENDRIFSGIFHKRLSSKDFMIGIKEILAGKRFVPPDQAHKIYKRDIQMLPTQDFGLSPREKDVLGFLVKGQSNKDIARALDLQVVTVKLHVRGICRKMAVANRTQAALLAKECGWG